MDRRFLRLLRWTVGATRAKLVPLGVHPEALPNRLTPFELQVNLCEWRKFLPLDVHRAVRVHIVSRVCVTVCVTCVCHVCVRVCVHSVHVIIPRSHFVPHYLRRHR